MASEQPTRIVRLRVAGMGCEGCVTSVRQALAGVPGVVRAEVDLEGGTAEVEAAAATDPQALVQAVDEAGYEAAPA
jgi:copper chaperone CopZ